MCPRTQKLLCNYSKIMKVAVLDINGKDTGRKVDLAANVFAIA
jgi:hypothetical protein